jgi:hypothetical protein
LPARVAGQTKETQFWGVFRLFLWLKMAKVITDLDDAIDVLNILYEGDSTPPASGEEDYTVWMGLMNTAINIWENEEGIHWKELWTTLTDTSTGGDTTTTAGDYSYALPTAFRYPGAGYVWIGSGSNKTAFKVIKQEDVQLHENDTSNWCYFKMDGAPTLEFNPNCTLPTGYTISYPYYKNATALASGTSTFEMSDPMFAVYYALSELKKEEGDTSALAIAQQKLEAMKTRNIEGSDWQETSFISRTSSGVV